jgi:hypothetical protein
VKRYAPNVAPFDIRKDFDSFWWIDEARHGCTSML